MTPVIQYDSQEFFQEEMKRLPQTQPVLMQFALSEVVKRNDMKATETIIRISPFLNKEKVSNDITAALLRVDNCRNGFHE